MGALVGLTVAVACGPEQEGDRCYPTNESPNTDDVIWTRICGVEFADIPAPDPFEDDWLVQIEVTDGDGCPMCATDLDPLLWEAFKDDVAARGLAPDEDPTCLDDGFSVIVACRDLVTARGDLRPDTECHYTAQIATNCTLADVVTPSSRPPGTSAGH